MQPRILPEIIQFILMQHLPHPSTTPVASRTDLIPRMGHAIRGWAEVDDNELIAYKKDTKSRHSWKVIGSKLHRDPYSCKARWFWLKSSRPDLPTPGADTEDRVSFP